MDNRKKIADALDKAMLLFNQKRKTDYSHDNTRLEFFDPQNGKEVYVDFCKKSFSGWLKIKEYEQEGFFEDVTAFAFTNKTEHGILVCETDEREDEEWLFIMLHELSHIFCLDNEIPDGNFFEKYCDICTDDIFEKGSMAAGYSIWREYIADIVAFDVHGLWLSSLEDVADDILLQNEAVTALGKDAKAALSQLLVNVILSREILEANSWNEAKNAIVDIIDLSYPAMYEIIRLCFEDLQKEHFWEITPDFIKELGKNYLMLCAEITLHGEI